MNGSNPPIPIHDLVKKFRELHTAATVPLATDFEPPRATDADLEGKIMPVTLYETAYTWRDNVMVSGAVHPITVTRHGIDRSVGATAPSISFIDHNRGHARGSANNFYLTKELAQSEVDHQLAVVARENARQELNALVLSDLGQILERFET